MVNAQRHARHRARFDVALKGVVLAAPRGTCRRHLQARCMQSCLHPAPLQARWHGQRASSLPARRRARTPAGRLVWLRQSCRLCRPLLRWTSSTAMSACNHASEKRPAPASCVWQDTRREAFRFTDLGRVKAMRSAPASTGIAVADNDDAPAADTCGRRVQGAAHRLQDRHGALGIRRRGHERRFCAQLADHSAAFRVFDGT